MDINAAVMATSFVPLQRYSESAFPIRLACPKPYSAREALCSTSLSSVTVLDCTPLLIRKPLSFGHRRRALPIIAKEGVERTYVMVKPDGVQRGLVGEIISRLERKGFSLKGLKLFQCPTKLAQEHYAELEEKPFFPKLVKYIVSGPVVCMAWEGPDVVASARKLIGTTNPLTAEPGTIRGDLAIATGRNVVHGSDSPDNGEREIALWFKDEELLDWEQSNISWLQEELQK